MKEKMIIRAAEEKDFWGLFLLYVPMEQYSNWPKGKRLSLVDMTHMLDTILSYPEYKFFVVEYKLEIVAAYGLRPKGKSVDLTAPVIGDIKIAYNVQNVLAIEELVEHAILQGLLAGYNHVTCISPKSDFLSSQIKFGLKEGLQALI